MNNTKKKSHTIVRLFFFGGDGGIRTHEPVKANAFRVRPVMTTSIRLPIHFFVSVILSKVALFVKKNPCKGLTYLSFCIII